MKIIFDFNDTHANPLFRTTSQIRIQNVLVSSCVSMPHNSDAPLAPDPAPVQLWVSDETHYSIYITVYVILTTVYKRRVSHQL
jgi:hypothetical protein